MSVSIGCPPASSLTGFSSSWARAAAVRSSSEARLLSVFLMAFPFSRPDENPSIETILGSLCALVSFFAPRGVAPALDGLAVAPVGGRHLERFLEVGDRGIPGPRRATRQPSIGERV